MLIIPAIDLKDGFCVRLSQGKMDQATVYSDDPVEMARRWEAEGAQRLHIVDLDGAIAGKPVNLKLVEKIRAAVNLDIEIGGGIRSMETVKQYCDAGVTYIILGTAAITRPDFWQPPATPIPAASSSGLMHATAWLRCVAGLKQPRSPQSRLPESLTAPVLLQSSSLTSAATVC